MLFFSMIISIELNSHSTFSHVQIFKTSSGVGLNSVHREILSSVIIVFYDKVRGRNKVQR